MNFCTVRCCICDSVLLNLPEEEIEKLNSLTFRCESCGHRLTLNGTNVTEAMNAEPFQSIFRYDFNI